MEGYIKSADTVNTPVVAHDSLITGNGPASTIGSPRYSTQLNGEDVAKETGTAMLFYPDTSKFYF